MTRLIGLIVKLELILTLYKFSLSAAYDNKNADLTRTIY